MAEIDLGLVVGGGGDDKMDKANPSGTGSLSMNRATETTVGENSTALGLACESSGTCSYAEGYEAKAAAAYAHCEGLRTLASSTWQHVQGRYNIEDTNGKYAHILGNGTGSVRSNAHTVDWNGNAWFSGDVSCGGSSGDAPSVSMGTEALTTTAKTLSGAVNELNSGKVDAEEGKGLSSNDFTDTLKTKLDGIATGANKTTVDSALSSSSTNPVQNKVVNTALGNKVDKVSGKGLSTNDFTAAYKTKLDNIGYTGITILNDKTIPSGSSVNMTDGISLAAGDYLVTANLRVAKIPIPGSSSTVTPISKNYSERLIWASFTTTSGGNTQHANMVPSDTETNNLNFSYILHLTSSATYYLNVGQKNPSDSSIKCTKSGSFCRILRIS